MQTSNIRTQKSNSRSVNPTSSSSINIPIFLSKLIQQTSLLAQNGSLTLKNERLTIEKNLSLLSKIIDAKFRGLIERLCVIQQSLKTELNRLVNETLPGLNEAVKICESLEKTSFSIASGLIGTPSIKDSKLGEIASSFGGLKEKLNCVSEPDIPEFELALDFSEINNVISSAELRIVRLKRMKFDEIRSNLSAICAALGTLKPISTPQMSPSITSRSVSELRKKFLEKSKSFEPKIGFETQLKRFKLKDGSAERAFLRTANSSEPELKMGQRPPGSPGAEEQLEGEWAFL